MQSAPIQSLRVSPFSGQTTKSLAVLSVFALFLALLCALAINTAQAQAATSIGLGAADSFAVLGASGVTNTGPSVINGDLGSSPNPSMGDFTGAPNGTVNGAVHAADPVADLAQVNLTTAYNNAAGQGPASTVATELGGNVFTPGVYNSLDGTLGITGPVTLNAQGNPDAVFIFQAATTLTTASASSVNFINGAQPCHVFWQIGSSATLGDNSLFGGNILAFTSITLGSGVNVLGRLLASNGSVTMINDTVTRVPCATSDGGGGGGGGGGTAPGTGAGTSPGNGGGGTGGRGNGGGGNGNGNNPNSPNVTITGVPGQLGGPPFGSGNPKCVDTGFLAKFHIQDKYGLRSAKVFLDGKLIKSSTSKNFSVWVPTLGLRSGKNTLGVRVVDNHGRRDTSSRTFRHCAPVAPAPEFTG